MDIITETALVKMAGDMVKNDNMLNKTASVMGMLFPFAGIRQKAVDMYIKEIEKSNLPSETKVYMILNARKTFKKIKNQKAIAEKAMSYVEEGTDFSEESGVSEEWLDRFMDSAGFVSSEEIQLIWAKILANEFEKPNSTPPNMVRVLSEITPDLARAFRCICSMSLWVMPLNEDGNIENNYLRIVVPYSDNEQTFRYMGLGFEVLNELEALGVMKFDFLVGYSIQGIKNKRILMRVGDKLDVIEEHRDDSIPSGNVLLTSVGEALRSIIESVAIDNYYEMTYGYLRKKGIRFAEEHDFVFRTDGDSIEIVRKSQHI